jgi:hypothetical protein
MKLYVPKSYTEATNEQLERVCNGCGTKGFGGLFVPDTMWGLNITECCNIHDWMYEKGETDKEKQEADRVFLNNLLRTIEAEEGWKAWLLAGVRRRRALKYYEAVRVFGGPAFWNGKNK